MVLHERPEPLWRRWTGIEPAGRGSLVPTALKAAESTRHPDTSVVHAIRPGAAASSDRLVSGAMKKIILLIGLLGVLAFAAKKVKSS